MFVGIEKLSYVLVFDFIMKPSSSKEEKHIPSSFFNVGPFRKK